MAHVKERGGGGEERKETLADKSLDFENRPLGLSLPADVLWGSFVTQSFLPHGPSWAVMPEFTHRHLMLSSTQYASPRSNL